MTSTSKLYVYGIIGGNGFKKPSIKGIDGAEVGLVKHGKMAAVVSPIRGEDIMPTLNNIRKHTEVQEEFSKGATLLPVSIR